MFPAGKLFNIQFAQSLIAPSHCAASAADSIGFRMRYAPASEIVWSALVPVHPVVAGHSSTQNPAGFWILTSQLPRITAAWAYALFPLYLYATASGYTASPARECAGFTKGFVLWLTSAP